MDYNVLYCKWRILCVQLQVAVLDRIEEDELKKGTKRTMEYLNDLPSAVIYEAKKRLRLDTAGCSSSAGAAGAASDSV